MRSRLIILFLSSAAVVLAAEDVKPDPKAVAAARNLVPNGDFEAGTVSPTGWQSVDGLSAFWVEDDDPAHGKVLKFDTDVLQSQAYEWWVKIADGAAPKDAPKKLPTVEPKYDTLAGLDGVWYWSDFIPIEKGKSYWLSLDAKGGPFLVWLVGYPEKGSNSFGADAAAFQEVLKSKRTGKEPVTDRKREVFVHNYIWKGQMPAGGSSEWKTYSRRAKPFRPTAVTPGVRYVRVMLYPFWPPATYKVDNVRLVALDDEEPGR